MPEREQLIREALSFIMTEKVSWNRDLILLFFVVVSLFLRVFVLILLLFSYYSFIVSCFHIY